MLYKIRDWTERLRHTVKVRLYVYARDRAMENDDYDWVRRNSPNPERMSDDMVYLVFHKVRVECVNVPEYKREQSRLWIEAHHAASVSHHATRKVEE